MGTRTTTVVFTGIDEFAKRADRLPRPYMLQLLERHEELLLPLVTHYGGVVVKTLGDSFLLTFESPTKAVLCCVMMQAKLRAYNESLQDVDEHIRIRVAINTGEVEELGDLGDIYGEAVNIASRVHDLSVPDEVYFCESTYLSMQKSEVPSSEVGEYSFHGIPGAIRVYRVLQDERLDVYRDVLESQPEPDANLSDTIRGVFSKGLLYSFEQQQLVKPARQPLGLPQVLIAGVVLLFVAAAMFFVGKEIIHARQRSVAKKMVDEGRARDALTLIKTIQQDRPTDEKLYRITERAVVAAVAKHTKEADYRGARKVLEFAENDFPYLQVVPQLEKKIMVDETIYAMQQEGETDYETVRELRVKYPTDPYVRGALAHTSLFFSNQRMGRPLQRNLDGLKIAFEAGMDEFRTPELTQNMLKVLSYSEPSEGPQDRFTFIKEHYWDEMKPELEKNLYMPSKSLGMSERRLRRSAYRLLSEKGHEIDEVKFFAIDFLYARPRSEFLNEKTYPFLEALIAKGTDPDATAYMSAEIDHIPVLNHVNSDDGERILKIINALFAEELRPFMESAVVGTDREIQRVSSYQVLKEKGWLTPELEYGYHLENLRDYDPRFHTWWHKEACDYFSNVADRKRAAEALPYLVRIKEEAAETGKEYGAIKAYKELMPAYMELSNKAARAIRHLGG